MVGQSCGGATSTCLPWTLPDDESWVQDEVAKIVATPWNFNPKKEEQEEAAPEVIPFEPKPDEEREPELVSKCVPRGVKITKAEIAEFRVHEGLPEMRIHASWGCQAILACSTHRNVGSESRQ